MIVSQVFAIIIMDSMSVPLQHAKILPHLTKVKVHNVLAIIVLLMQTVGKDIATLIMVSISVHHQHVLHQHIQLMQGLFVMDMSKNANKTKIASLGNVQSIYCMDSIVVVNQLLVRTLQILLNFHGVMGILVVGGLGFLVILGTVMRTGI